MRARYEVKFGDDEGCVTMRTMRRAFWVAMLSVMGLGCGDPGVQLDDWAEHLVAAQEAIESGDRAKAIEELTASIESEPNIYAYYDRAKLYSEAGDEKAALEDCEAGLALGVEHKDLKWLYGELKKPRSKRFKGKFANPPSDLK